MKQTGILNSCGDCKFRTISYKMGIAPKFECRHEHRPNFMAFSGGCYLWEKRINSIGKVSFVEDLINCNEILQKVDDEGFDKVSDELMCNPDYLGERRATLKLLDKAAKAVNETLELINKVRQEIDMNI